MKKYLTLSLLLLLIISLPGCTILRSKATTPTKLEILPNQWVVLPTPAQLAFKINATQILTAEYKIKNQSSIYTSQVQVETTPEHLILVAVAGWGSEIFSINYDGATIKTNSLPLPNFKIGIQHTLTDFILTYASPRLLQKMLKTSALKLILKPRQRLFMLKNTPVIQIDYTHDNPWHSHVVLRNFNYHYTIKISTITYTSP